MSSLYKKFNPNLSVELFSTPVFDAESEHIFWCERQREFQTTLKTALLLGVFGLLTFLGLKFFNGGVSFSGIFARLITITMLAGLFAILQFRYATITQLRCIAKSGVAISSIHILLTLLFEKSVEEYTESWSGLLAIYFFTYGQIYFGRIDALIFGWISMLVIVGTGYQIGLTYQTLTPSILILSIVNIFGYLTRCQLEIYSRNAFRDRCQAERSTSDKTLYLCQLSHNLRQYVQTISCYSSVLENEMARSSRHELLPIAHKLGNAVDELNSAFNHILDIAHLETGRQTPYLASVNLNVLLDALEVQFAPLALKRGLRLKLLRRIHPPFSVQTDANILQQILANLIDNAIKYTTQGWVLVACVKLNTTQIKIHVRDTGVGISEEMHEHIFKEFYRGGRRQSDAQVYGLGIGLSYVLKATQHLPGHLLEYSSRLNRGSDFTVSLPVGQIMSSGHCASETQSDLSGSFILAVDDDALVLNALAEQLRSWGCLVQQAKSKAETLDCLADIIRPPDLLITDFYLDNHETAHDIIAIVQADCGHVPALILSAHTIPYAEKAKWPENTLLLRKPANAAELMATMAKALGKYS